MARSACASSGHSTPSRPASMPWPTKTSAASVAPSSRPSSLESGNPPPPEDFRGRHARAAPDIIACPRAETPMTNSFRARSTLTAGASSYEIWSLAALPQDKLARLPYSLKILLENLLRFEDGVSVTRADIEALLEWDPRATPSHEIAFTPARVILQDFTGVPCVVDLAAMRDAIVRLGGNAERVNPLNPAELVIDHSVQVDEYGTPKALAANTAMEFARNRERYAFLRWGQTAFRNFSVVPPNTGIVHQVNLEYLGRVIFDAEAGGTRRAYPDTLVGTDSHTTMINGLGVLGWGVGGIEAEAAMLGQPVTMLIPQVLGFRLDGRLQPGATATDLVLTVTEMLRKKGVVDKFVEFFGDGLANLPLADRATIDGRRFELEDGAVLIAAITSCTNTSNPSVMLAAGLLARKARQRGLKPAPWVKTSLAPGSRVVTDYFAKAGVLDDLAAVGFSLVGYGCTTCIGNSGPLKPEISAAVKAGDLTACAVLSGNRNFEGRVHPETRMNFLASPPLVVAYALAGTLDIDLATEPLGPGSDGKPVYLKDLWPSDAEVQELMVRSIDSQMFRSSYANVFKGDENWTGIQVPAGQRYAWDPGSTYVKNPPYFDAMSMTPPALEDVRGARVLALLGDSVTTDHISPAGNIARNSPAARYLVEHGVDPKDFNSYGARRGNHEVMMRGTFANIRLRNLLVPGVEGGVSVHLPDGEQASIYDVAMRYRKEGTPLVVLAGREYGTGSSRDWAAKGAMLLGVKAVIAESFERIHRSNLIGMGVAPLQFLPGQNASSLGLTGREVYAVEGLSRGDATEVTVTATPQPAKPGKFTARLRIDTPKEREYYRHGGILQYVLRQLATAGSAA